MAKRKRGKRPITPIGKNSGTPEPSSTLSRVQAASSLTGALTILIRRLLWFVLAVRGLWEVLGW